MPNKTLEKWEEKTLDDVCKINYGTRVVKSRDAGTIYPVYGGGGATFSMNTFNREDCMIVARFAMSEKCTRFVKGKFFLNDSGLTVETKISNLNQNFIDWQLISLNDKIYSLGRGSAQKNLNVDLFKKIQIKYPTDVEEQQRIVGILDVAFENIEKAKQNALQNLNNAKELFESRLNKTFLNIDKNVNKKLSELAQIIGGGTPSKDNKSFYIGDIPWATVRDMNTDLLTETEFLINEDAVKNSSTNIIPAGNIIIATRVGLGKVCILAQDTAINQDLKGIMPVKQITSKFLFWWFKSIKNKIIESGIGATVKGVKLPFIQNLDVPFINIKEQQKIVAQLDELQEQTKRLEQIYEQKIKDLDELKQSILQKAFNGEL